MQKPVYRVITHSNLDRFQECIQEYIDNAHTTFLGGVTYGDGEWAQAIVTLVETEDEVRLIQ